MQCSDIEVVAGCRRGADGKPLGSLSIHYEYRTSASGARTLHATRYSDSTGAIIAIAGGEVVSVGACEFVPLIVDASKEFVMRFDTTTPTHTIDPGMVDGIAYDSISISNLNGYDGVGPARGDFKPFSEQDPLNTTVLWAEIMFQPAQGAAFNAWHIIPPGTKIIQMQDASIIGVARIAVADKMPNDIVNSGGIVEVKALSNGSAPSKPVYATIAFNRSNAA
jgi:hypothetical protein